MDGQLICKQGILFLAVRRRSDLWRTGGHWSNAVL